MTRYYKLLLPSGRTLHGRSGWTIPTDAPGPWIEAHDPGPLVPCRNGVHVLTVAQLPYWADTGTVLVEVEVSGDEVLTDTEKTVVRRARPVRVVPGWSDRALSRWGHECAARDPAARPPALVGAAAYYADRAAHAAAYAIAPHVAARYAAAYAAERTWQSRRLAELVGLDPES